MEKVVPIHLIEKKKPETAKIRARMNDKKE